MCSNQLVIPEPLPERIKIFESPSTFRYPENYHLAVELNGSIREYEYDKKISKWVEIGIDFESYSYPKIRLTANMINDEKCLKRIRQLAKMYCLITYQSEMEPDVLVYYAKDFPNSNTQRVFPALYELINKDTFIKIEEKHRSIKFISHEFDEESEVNAKQFIKELQILSEIYAAKQLKDKVKNSKDFYIISKDLLNFHSKGLAIIPINEDYNFICWKIPFILQVMFSKEFQVKISPPILLNYKEVFRLRIEKRFWFRLMNKINIT